LLRLTSFVAVNIANAVDQVIGGGVETEFEGVDFSLLSAGVTFAGSTASEVVIGSSLSDTLEGGAGDDTIDGGAGNDLAVYSGARSDYNVSTALNGDIIIADLRANADDTDTVRNVEQFQFADGTRTLAELFNEAPTNLVVPPIAAIAENTAIAAGTVAATFSYSDDARGTESVTLTGADAALFEVVGNEVRWLATTTPDFEAKAAYNFTINVDDPTIGTGPELSEAVIINVTDVPEGMLINGTPGNDTLNGTANADVINGGAGNDTLNGGGGNDQLTGGSGADTLNGGTGNDIYYIDNAGDLVNELTGEGIDLVNTILTNYTLGGNVENAILTRVSAGNLVGNGLDNQLTGNDAANILKGGSGNDTLIGNGGNDNLNGETGNDIMIGGTGNDTYTLGSTLDVVTENLSEGTDTVRTTLTTYTLGSNVENFVYIGGRSVNATGNALNNEFTGGAGNDRFTGLVGLDILTGGSGSDTFIYTAIADSVGTGVDRIQDFEAGFDRIDLSLMDANELLTGNQAFTFVAGNAFSGAGQLIALNNVAANRVEIRGNTDADAASEFQIYLNNQQLGPSFTINSLDFIL